VRAAFGRSGFVVLTVMQFLYPFIGKTRDFHLSHGDVVVITHKGVVPSFDLLMEALKP